MIAFEKSLQKCDQFNYKAKLFVWTLITMRNQSNEWVAIDISSFYFYNALREINS